MNEMKVSSLFLGKVTGMGKMSDTTEAELIRMMVGRDVLIESGEDRVRSDDKILRVSDLYLRHPYVRHRQVLKNISFDLHKGEILGIFGLNVLRQISVNVCIAVGMTLVVLMAGIDLSVGSIPAF